VTITAVGGQQGGVTVDGSATATRAFPSNVALGNLVVVMATRNNIGNTAFAAGDCTKSAGTATLGTITLVTDVNFDIGGGNIDQVGIWVAKVTGAGSLTMAVNGTSVSAFMVMSTAEFASDLGWGPNIEASSTGTQASDGTTSWATGNMTSAAGALFLGHVGGDGSSNISLAPGTGWTTIYNESDPVHTTGLSQYRITGVKLSDAANGSIANTNLGWLAVGAVINELAPAIPHIQTVRPRNSLSVRASGLMPSDRITP
jgi:hypothetical protein